MRADFVRYVEGGGGVVAMHAANNAFTEWPEYNRMTGLGGWYGRTEKAGPYVYFKDDKLVRKAERPQRGLGRERGPVEEDDAGGRVGGGRGHPGSVLLVGSSGQRRRTFSTGFRRSRWASGMPDPRSGRR